MKKEKSRPENDLVLSGAITCKPGPGCLHGGGARRPAGPLTTLVECSVQPWPPSGTRFGVLRLTWFASFHQQMLPECFSTEVPIYRPSTLGKGHHPAR